MNGYYFSNQQMTRIMTERAMREWIIEHNNDEAMNLNDWDVSNVHNMSGMLNTAMLWRLLIFQIGTFQM